MHNRKQGEGVPPPVGGRWPECRRRKKGRITCSDESQEQTSPSPFEQSFNLPSAWGELYPNSVDIMFRRPLDEGFLLALQITSKAKQSKAKHTVW